MRGFLRVPPLPHLRSIDVSGSSISGCDGLAACPLLERLVLFHTQMVEAPPSSVVMKSLCELFLNNCKLTWMRECPELPLLRYLSVADNRCVQRKLKKAMHSPHRSLSISLHCSRTGSLERLPPLSGCPALLHLDVSFNCLSRSEDLQSFTACPILQRLHLNDNPLCLNQFYRPLVIALSPSLVELDASPVSAAEREGSVAVMGGISQRWACLLRTVRGKQIARSVCPTAIASVASGQIINDGQPPKAVRRLNFMTDLLFSGFAPQARLWGGLGLLSAIVNERENRNAVLSVHNAELRAATASGDEMRMLQVARPLLSLSDLAFSRCFSCA
jgi:hypothetical protein